MIMIALLKASYCHKYQTYHKISYNIDRHSPMHYFRNQSLER